MLATLLTDALPPWVPPRRPKPVPRLRRWRAVWLTTDWHAGAEFDERFRDLPDDPTDGVEMWTPPQVEHAPWLVRFAMAMLGQAVWDIEHQTGFDTSIAATESAVDWILSDVDEATSFVHVCALLGYSDVQQAQLRRWAVSVPVRLRPKRVQPKPIFRPRYTTWDDEHPVAPGS